MKFGRYEIVQRANIQLFENNPRTHSPEQIEQLRASYKEFGFTNPILLDEQYRLIAGHGRLAAGDLDGMTEYPAIIVEGLTDAQRRALVIADNQIALNAGWDLDRLRAELLDLKAMSFDVGKLGFSKLELADYCHTPTTGLVPDDDAPSVPVAPVSRVTDVWRLGNHLVLCGDATKPEDLATLMGGASADMVFTDPPYNVDYEGAAGKIKNDKMADDAFYKFLFDFYKATHSVMKNGAALYVAHADTEGLNFRRAFIDAGFKLSGCIIWRKPSLVLGRSDYQWQHEPILYGWKSGAAHRFFGGRKQTTMVDAGPDLGFRQNEDGSWSFAHNGSVLTVAGENLTLQEDETSVITVDKPRRSEEHPTMKPIELIERYLHNSSKPGDLVLDPFGGSGSTLIACEKHGRHCRMVELDERFVDVIVNRWQNYTGQKAIHAQTGESFEEVSIKRINAGESQQ